MREFKSYHPIVNFAFFLCVIRLTCFYLHPIFIGVSFLCGFIYSVMTGGKRALGFNFLFVVPLILITAVINPLFNHGGITIISYFPNGNPLTAESIIYGIASGAMLASVIIWFSSYNKIMTSDKFIYLFGKVIPALSLILSMALRFVPRFKEKFEEIRVGQKCIGKGMNNGNIFQRIKNALRIISIMITWALENSVETADSMRSRGYGLSGRGAFSNFIFDKRDAKAFGCILIFAIYTIIGIIWGDLDYTYFPSFKVTPPTLYAVSIFISYILLCSSPIIIEIYEAIRWKLLKQKI